MSGRVGHQLGNYHLIQFLGKGGFADVYLGEHIQLKSQAAIKVLHTKLSEKHKTDFLTEAQRLVGLRHSHIVRFFDFGIEGDDPFLVMEYAPNGTLRRRHPEGSRIPLETIISYVKQVANALQYMHEQKLVHRDIKPANILVGADQALLLSDIGIAVPAHREHSLSTQDIVGTPAYMAPEQLQGKPCTASDQYALGIVVYEWLCGERPFKGSPFEIATQHLLTSPPALREKYPMTSLDAERVVMKALSKDPRNRFESVQEFSYALEQATAPPVGTVICMYSGHTESVTSLAWTPDSQYIVSCDEDRVHVWDVTTGGTILTFERGPSYASPLMAWSPNGKGIAFYTERTVQIWDVVEKRQTFVSTEQIESVESLLWSTNGFHVVSLTSDYFEALKIWSPIDNRAVVCKCFHHILYPTSSPDGKYIAAWSMSFTHDYEPVTGSVVVWDTSTGDEVLEYHCSEEGGEPLLLEWSPDSRCLVSENGLVFQVWDVTKRQVIAKVEKESVHEISWAPNGKYIAYVGGNVQVLDTTTGGIILAYQGHTYWRNNMLHLYGAFDVVWSPDGKRIASLGYEDNEDNEDNEDYTVQIHVWDATTGNNVVICCCQHYAKLRPPEHMAVWSPDSRFIVSAIKDIYERSDCIVQVWDASTGNISHTFREHSDQVNALAWAPNGKYIASASDDKTVCVWVAPTFAL